LHNCAKLAGGKLQTDLGSLVVKIFNHFSSAKCTEELKAIFDFLGEDHDHLLHHLGTRWLSLYLAIKRLAKCWPDVKLPVTRRGSSPNLGVFRGVRVMT
jgi:hypothetical protein